MMNRFLLCFKQSQQVLNPCPLKRNRFLICCHNQLVITPCSILECLNTNKPKSRPSPITVSQKSRLTNTCLTKIPKTKNDSSSPSGLEPVMNRFLLCFKQSQQVLNPCPFNRNRFLICCHNHLSYDTIHLTTTSQYK
jgi:hypothetical protein